MEKKEKIKYEKLDKIIAYFSDRTYWLKKCNKQKLNNIQDRKAYARSLLKAGEEIASLNNDVMYYKDRADIRQKTITKQKEEIKNRDIEIAKLKDLIKQLKSNIDNLRSDENV